MSDPKEEAKQLIAQDLSPNQYVSREGDDRNSYRVAGKVYSEANDGSVDQIVIEVGSEVRTMNVSDMSL